MAQGFNFPLSFVFGAVDKLTGPLGRMEGKLAGFGRKATAAGKALTAGVTLPLLALGGLAIKAGADFESGMLRVQALSESTAEEIAGVRTQAKELGRTTQFSASQAAEGFTFFAQQGFKVREMLASMPGVLDLAAASQEELGVTSNIAAGALRGYNFQAGQMARVTDVLAKAQASSATNLVELSEGFKLAGPVAAGLGLEFEETVAVLGKMADAQFKGTLGGTALKRALSNLIQPSTAAQRALGRLGIFRDDLLDAEGNLKSFIGTIELLSRRGATASDVLTIFGDRAFAPMLSLIQAGAGPLRELQRELEGAEGVAGRMARTQMSGATGASLEFKSAIEGLLIAIAESGLLEAFTSLLKDHLTPLVSKLAETDPKFLKIATVVGLVVAALGPLILIGGQAVTLIGGLASVAGVVGPLLGSLAVVLINGVIPAVWAFTVALVANPIGATILAITALIGVGVLLWKNWDKVTKFLSFAWEKVKLAAAAYFKFVFGWALKLTEFLPDWIKDKLGIGGKGELNVNVDGNRAVSAAASTSSTRVETIDRRESRVAVSFDNLPKGSRVRRTGDAELDLDMGFAGGAA